MTKIDINLIKKITDFPFPEIIPIQNIPFWIAREDDGTEEIIEIKRYYIGSMSFLAGISRSGETIYVPWQQ